VHCIGDTLERSATQDGCKVADEVDYNCAVDTSTPKNIADGRVGLPLQGSSGGDTFTYGQLSPYSQGGADGRFRKPHKAHTAKPCVAWSACLLSSAASLVTHFALLRSDGQAELTWVK